jgi:hypothetical protein
MRRSRTSCVRSLLVPTTSPHALAASRWLGKSNISSVIELNEGDYSTLPFLRTRDERNKKLPDRGMSLLW